MTLKVLLLNFPREDILATPTNFTIEEARINKAPTLHDFHVIIMDTSEIFETKWWEKPETYRPIRVGLEIIEHFQAKVKEQVETGGVMICFSSEVKLYRVETGRLEYGYGGKPTNEIKEVSNYFFCPVKLGIVSDYGDTFHPRFEELRYFNPLLKQIPRTEISYKCYFSNLPSETRILATNRAGYPVFVEVPLGAGKLLMLPHFKDRAKAATILVKDVIPQIVQEEEPMLVPQWLSSFSSPYEAQIKENIAEIERAKRLLYTKDKILKKTVAFALDKLGFTVQVLPDGTLLDLRITDGEKKAICEVKGHENTQSDRRDLLQLLGYSTEQDMVEKGIFVSNHEFSKKPEARSEEAFTHAAIQLAKKNELCLISACDLYNVLMQLLQDKLGSASVKAIRAKIINGSELVHLP
jgi:hypothetical protein